MNAANAAAAAAAAPSWHAWSPLTLALLGSLFTWGVTALGAALVIFTKTVDMRLMDFSLGSAAGVMVAASCFGLLAPAMEMAAHTYGAAYSWFPASVGVAISFYAFFFFQDWLEKRQQDHDIDPAVALALGHSGKQHATTDQLEEQQTAESMASGSVDYLSDARGRHGKRQAAGDGSRLRHRPQQQHQQASASPQEISPSRLGSRAAPEKLKQSKSSWNRVVLLIAAITVHNFPEGLAVGVAFGAASACRGDAGADDGFGSAGGQAPPPADICGSASFGSAIALTIGIGLQNFPEGMAVSLPLRREGLSIGRALWYGQLSGIVEPFGAVLGAYATTKVRGLLPYALGFAAGAMLFVVVTELNPQPFVEKRNTKIFTQGFMVGFLLMMTLDVAFAA